METGLQRGMSATDADRPLAPNAARNESPLNVMQVVQMTDTRTGYAA